MEILCKHTGRYPEDAWEWDGVVTEKMIQVGEGFWGVNSNKFRAYVDCEIFTNGFLPDYWNDIVSNSIKIVRDKRIKRILDEDRDSM
jgi:hypothetical protein